MAEVASRTPLLITLAIVCAGLSFLANTVLMPAYRRYALARPNARSSHTIPTPQGGGAGVLIGMLAGLLCVAGVWPGSQMASWTFGALASSAGLLAITGALDDIFDLPVSPRLLAQFAAAALGLVWVLSATNWLSVGPASWVAVPVLLLGLVGFVNFSNFMDGIDGMTVAEFTPICGTLALLSMSGALPLGDGLVAAALLGALAGFAPYNLPVARLFLGDAGSLSIGLIAGCLLLRLAISGQPVSALILPLYYLADATITLVRRLVRGENVTQAHRTHFYQLAVDQGWTVPAILRTIWLLNSVLVLLSLVSVWLARWDVRVTLLAIAMGLVALTLRALSRPPVS